MTWYEDVDRRLDNIEKVLVRVLKRVDDDGKRLDSLQGIVGNGIADALGIPPIGAPAGEPPARSVSSVTPTEDDGPDDDEPVLDLPPLPADRCNHQHQRLDHATKRIVCAQCGVPLTDVTGVLTQGTVSKSGEVVTTVSAEDLPEWAREARQGQ